MSLPNYYASIAVVEIHPGEKVTIESISVSKGECVLSGAWDFSTSDKLNIDNVVSGKLIIPLGDTSAVKQLLINSDLKYLSAKPFLQEAKEAANDAIASFSNDDPLFKTSSALRPQ